MQEPERQNNIKDSKIFLHVKCKDKIKNKPLFDINLFTVAFENHSAPCRFFGNLRSKFAPNPLACKSFISGKCGSRCSKCPATTFSD
jgi:hypothetical protein